MARDRTPAPTEAPTTPAAPVSPVVTARTDAMTNWYQNQYAAMLAAAPLGYAGAKLIQNADTVVPAINNTVGQILPTSITTAGVLSNVAAPIVVGRAASNVSRYLLPNASPYLHAGVGAAVGGATVALPSHFGVSFMSAIAAIWAGNKAVQWGGLNRSVYQSMDGQGYWNFTKRNITSTPGKLGMGLFYSGWRPSLHDDLRWQERIGAVVPQLARGTVRSLYTPWDKLQGFEKVPGFAIRPVVSALSTVWNAIPGTGMLKSPDAFGQGVGNIALAPIRAPGYVWGKMKDFWKWGTSDPSAKK